MNTRRDMLNDYHATTPFCEHEILVAAEDILWRRLERQGELKSPRDTEQFLRIRLGALQHEEFHCVFLDNRHRVIAIEKLFNGTIDGASVHPREVVRAALRHNAAAVIFGHNHPSGVAEPSSADRAITRQLRDALSLIAVRVLDHIVVGETTTSMAQRGLI
jgi:DNA repair protein RadC